MEMKKNVGASDRYVRTILGLGCILNIFSLEPSRFGLFILLLVGLSILFSAYTQYCWIYDLLKINTYEKKKKPSESAEQTPSH
jgi:Inner membrane protein YgaP-like, transmembrane domain